MPTIPFTYTSPQDASEVTCDLPATWEVCRDCRGEGRTLRAGMRGLMTQEEFERDFSREDQEEYLKGGHGIYGEECQTCKGRTTVMSVDLHRLRTQNPKVYSIYIQHLRDERDYMNLVNSERMFGA